MGIIKGKAADFFEGNANTFTGLFFNLADEVIEFYLPMKMKDDRNWISVTELMQAGAGAFVTKAPDQETQLFYLGNIDKLNKLDSIKKTDFCTLAVLNIWKWRPMFMISRFHGD
jgi:hypothetical protein